MEIAEKVRIRQMAAAEKVRLVDEVLAERVRLIDGDPWPEGFTWDLDLEVGHYPVTEHPYDADYFEKYEGYAETPMGEAITKARVELVAKHFHGLLLDVGIGCGSFVESRPLTAGFDINPAGIEWLKDRGLFLDPADSKFEAVSMWDVMEHLPQPMEILDRVRRVVFLSLPIFTGPYHVVASKHFRTDEHVWYWTLDGLIRFMAEAGYGCVYHGTPEIGLGREDIHSFVFRRVMR